MIFTYNWKTVVSKEKPQVFFTNISFSDHSGLHIRLWEGWWLGNCDLAEMFLYLFSIAVNPKAWISGYVEYWGGNCVWFPIFCRNLHVDECDSLMELSNFTSKSLTQLWGCWSGFQVKKEKFLGHLSMILWQGKEILLPAFCWKIKYLPKVFTFFQMTRHDFEWICTARCSVLSTRKSGFRQGDPVSLQALVPHLEYL